MGICPPHKLNESGTVFPPTGVLDEDHHQVIREAGDTRPLSLKNSDDKMSTATVNDSVSNVISTGTHKSKNGFVKGRRLLQNLVDLDSFAGLLSVIASTYNIAADPGNLKIAILAFFDFASAFP